MIALGLALWLVLGSQVFASTTWEQAFKAQPLPCDRDHASKDYFVAVVSNPEDVSGWHLEEPMPIRNHWLFSVPKGESHLEKLHRRDAVPKIYPSKVKRLHKRVPLPVMRDNEAVDRDAIVNEFEIHDPLFASQWHLVNDQEIGNDMRIIDVWRRNITGKGVSVAIVDDGLDSTHPDLQDSFFLEGSWDYNDHQNLPEPKNADDRHGTRCAGEIAAAHNDVCGVGVAPGARVAGIRILSGPLTDADEARAMIHGMDVNSIYSCSWGPRDDGRTVEAPPLIVQRAILEGVERGRQGKGSLYVFAAGNGFFSGDNCNYDGYTNSIYSVTVAAVDRLNQHPYYGESCSANMITTYSSNAKDKITTSDRVGGRKFEEACTSGHSGTSAAAPLVAGVFALVLEERSDLTWRDVQYLCRETAKKFELEEGMEWQTTHDGKQYHNHYGFGLLDADALVKRASTWDLVGPQSWFIGEKQEVNQSFNGTDPVEFSYTVTQEEWDNANLKHLEHVNVVVSVDYPLRGGIRYSLRSPSGFTSVLAERRVNDNSNAPLADWQFMSVAHWGENGVGEWKLIVEGSENLEGTLRDMRLKLWGHAEDVSVVRRFSDEWDKYEEHIDADQYDPAAHPTPISATTELPKPAGPSTSSFSQALPDTIPEATDVAGAEPAPTDSPSEPENSSSDKPEEKPDEPDQKPEEPPEDQPDNDQESEEESDASDQETGQSPHHSIWYYIGVTVVGSSIVAAVLLPFGWYYFRRKPGFTIDDGDFALIPSDVELSDMNDFAISSEDEPEDASFIEESDMGTPSEGPRDRASERLL